MSDGAVNAAGEADNRDRARRVFLLLEHLQKQGDTRLQSRFEELRRCQVSPSPIITKPPSLSGTTPSYTEFLAKLVAIRESLGRQRPAIPTDDDVFLRQSEDFLATIAAPATAETIETTQEYVKTRTGWALQGWVQWLRDLLGPLNQSASGGGAFWLARSARHLEIWAVVVTSATVALSVYAMVGRVVVDDEHRALTTYLVSSTNAWDDDDVACLRIAEPYRLRASGANVHISTERDTSPSEQDWTTVYEPPDDCKELSREFRPIAAVVPAVGETLVDLEAACRRRQWALMGPGTYAGNHGMTLS